MANEGITNRGGYSKAVGSSRKATYTIGRLRAQGLNKNLLKLWNLQIERRDLRLEKFRRGVSCKAIWPVVSLKKKKNSPTQYFSALLFIFKMYFFYNSKKKEKVGEFSIFMHSLISSTSLIHSVDSHTCWCSASCLISLSLQLLKPNYFAVVSCHRFFSLRSQWRDWNKEVSKRLSTEHFRGVTFQSITCCLYGRNWQTSRILDMLTADCSITNRPALKKCVLAFF